MVINTQKVLKDFGMEDLYPAAFPHVPTAKLEVISLAKLIENDKSEVEKIVQIFKEAGFFQLDLTDHPDGRELLKGAVSCCRVGMDVFQLPLEQKRLFKMRGPHAVLDKGYFTKFLTEDGTVRFNESINIPANEMFSFPRGDLGFPDWLIPHSELFASTMASGNRIASHLFTILEQALQLTPGALTSSHQLNVPSGDYLRLLHYVGQKPGLEDQLTFPAHKDATSMALLFNWLGGLQISADNEAAWRGGPDAVPEESWRWVEPVPGCVIVNLGDAMEVLTNKVLKSGLHRVVRAPGEQAIHDRYSVLIGTRPNNTVPMTPFKSSCIPEQDAKEASEPVMTSDEWKHWKLRMFNSRIRKREQDKTVLTLNK
ncbi:oxidoreductase [Paraphoma chrysanthemicola]|uniref:Oxidoreductase n=1 Tax=Paraphoma chrysanthemicola TaxID=798071 RepID=A0A8K0W3G6_9PLEO|nr:oxidoreductase [Paraphoma chrysanthemicola]